MALLNYDSDFIIEMMLNTHNPDLCPIRADFIEKEMKYIRKIGDPSKRILVAGSGLGLEVKEIAKRNQFVLGIDNNMTMIKMAQAYIKAPNIKFALGDFTNLALDDKSYDQSVLNFGTIGNFSERDQIRIIKELLRVSTSAHIDFYTPEATELRLKMYEEEGWRNVTVKGNAIVGPDAYSKFFTLDEFSNLVSEAGGYIQQTYPIKYFGYMTRISKLG